MDAKTLTPVLTFSRALQSFESGAIQLDALEESLQMDLASGVAPSSLLRVLDQHRSSRALPPEAREAFVGQIRRWASGDGQTEEATVILDEEAVREVEPLVAPKPDGNPLGGRYRLLELIGEGGMSRVFRSMDLSISPDAPDQCLAVKLFSRTFADPTSVFVSVGDEFKKLKGLAHPHIVRYLDCGLENGSIYLCMEYLPGQSLYARMHGPEASRPTRQQKLGIIDQLADAIEFAHRHSIVHGDLKPGNVLIGANGFAKVIDFAIADLIAPKSPVALTPRYASPQLLSRHRAEPTDDVYALACITYELLTGRHPSLGEHAGQQVSAFPPSASAELSDAQYSALVHALQPERAQRTASIAQFREEWAAAPRRTNWTLPGVVAALVVVAITLGWYAMHAYWTRSTRTAAQVETTPSAASVPATGTSLRDCANCPVMKVLPAGQFVRGASLDDASASALEKPQHLITIARPFAMAVNPVTVGQFEEFVNASGRDMAGCEVYDGAWHVQASASWRQPGFEQSPDHPVVCTSWNDAVAYAEWLSEKTGHRFRLPSSAEWEYAARAGQGPTPWGVSPERACASANVADESAAKRYPGWTVFGCNDGFVNTSPVGSFAANAFGLNDMLGNAFAWNQDCWHANYVDAPADGSARLDANCVEHELRGGSWFSAPAYLRASYRNHFTADYRGSSVGIRLVMELTP